MNVAELIERLNEFAPDAEVRLAVQPSWWPLQSHLAGVATVESEDDDGFVENEIVYLVDGGQVYDNPYAPRSVFDNVM